MSIGAVYGQAMFAQAVATQLYSGSAENSIPGSLLNSDPILQSLDAAQSTIVAQVGGAAALRTALTDLEDAMGALTRATQTMEQGETSEASVTALLDAMNGLSEVLDRHAATLNPRLRITLDEVARLTAPGLEKIGVTFDRQGQAELNEVAFARVLQQDPMAVADALYGDMGLAPGLAAITDVYYSTPPAEFVSEDAIAALNPLNAAGASPAGSGAFSELLAGGGLPGMTTTVGAYAMTMPGPVQGALLSLTG